MKIVFLGDISHPNAQSWINALEKYEDCQIVTWSLPTADDRSGKFARVSAWIKAIFSIKKYIKQTNPDILIAYRITSYGFLGAVSGFHPLVVASQGESDVWPQNSISTPIKAAMAKLALKKADLIHAWGEHIAKTNKDLGADPNKILVLPRGIDISHFYAPKSPKIFDELKLIVTRSLFEEYRHNLIIEAVKKINLQGIPISLTIVGDGAELENLQKLTSGLGIDHIVYFTGKITSVQLADYLRNANIYVSMPITEGVSASLFEAMACCCYPVVTDLTANRIWIKHDINGKLIPVDDVDKLTNSLSEIWNDKDKLQNALDHNLKLVQEKASIQKNIATFVEHYRKLIKK